MKYSSSSTGQETSLRHGHAMVSESSVSVMCLGMTTSHAAIGRRIKTETKDMKNPMSGHWLPCQRLQSAPNIAMIITGAAMCNTVRQKLARSVMSATDGYYDGKSRRTLSRYGGWRDILDNRRAFHEMSRSCRHARRLNWWHIVSYRDVGFGDVCTQYGTVTIVPTYSPVASSCRMVNVRCKPPSNFSLWCRAVEETPLVEQVAVFSHPAEVSWASNKLAASLGSAAFLAVNRKDRTAKWSKTFASVAVIDTPTTAGFGGRYSAISCD